MNAVEAVTRNHAPWSKIESESIAPPANSYGSQEIAQLIEDADVVIDATGNDAFVGFVARVAVGLGRPLVSGTLLCSGFVGRVQRKALETDSSVL